MFQKYANATILTALFTAVFCGGIGTPALAADGYDRWVEIVNDTSADIYQFRASNSDNPDYGPDLLGLADVIPAGGARWVLIDDGTGYCLYDFKADFADGRDALDSNVNVCAVDWFRYW